MNRADYIEKNQDKSPYSDLYVYYFKGHVAPGTDLRAEEFIGNWEEDAFSFTNGNTTASGIHSWGRQTENNTNAFERLAYVY